MNISFNSNIANFKVRRQQFGIFSLIFLLLFGAVFAGSGLFFINSSKIDSSWNRISGEIVDSSSRISNESTTYNPVIQYSVDGQNYRLTSSSGSSFYPNIGGKLEVAYNPSRPDQAKVVDGVGAQAFLWLFPVIGIGILVLAPILFIRSMHRSKKIKNLMQTGQKLQGVLVDVQSTGSSDNNNTYKIVVSATDISGAVQNYVSDQLGGIGGLAMADFRKNPIPIDVYVDPANSQNYYVDISDVPNLTPERIGELIKSAANKQPQSIVGSEQIPKPTEAQTTGEIPPVDKPLT